MIHLDGSRGEGGGQILRSALALSLVSARPFEIRKIRAGRRRPGLLHQHLVAVEAAAAAGEAAISGAELGSSELTFRPAGLRHGEFSFSIGTAGSATLVVQAVLPALLSAEGPSRIVVEGGTHNPSAPPFEFLAHSFVPLLRRMGAEVEARLDRAGFYPAGGGRLSVEVLPSTRPEPLHLPAGGEIERISVQALVAGLPRHIAQRELSAVSRELPVHAANLEIRELPSGWGPGNAVCVQVERREVTAVFTGFGRRGVRAEQVGREAASEARRYLDSDAAVDRHLADQLLLPLSLGAGGSFTTTELSEHARTNAWVIEQFLPIEIVTETDSRGRCRVEVKVKARA